MAQLAQAADISIDAFYPQNAIYVCSVSLEYVPSVSKSNKKAPSRSNARQCYTVIAGSGDTVGPLRSSELDGGVLWSLARGTAHAHRRNKYE
jgi:hypothetical protein